MTLQTLRLDHVAYVIAQALGLQPGERVVGVDGRQDVPDEIWVTVATQDSLRGDAAPAHQPAEEHST